MSPTSTSRDCSAAADRKIVSSANSGEPEPEPGAAAGSSDGVTAAARITSRPITRSTAGRLPGRGGGRRTITSVSTTGLAARIRASRTISG